MSDSDEPPAFLLPVMVCLIALIPCAFRGFLFLRCNGGFR